MKKLLEWYWWRRQDKACLQLKARFRYTMFYPVMRFKPYYWRYTRYHARMYEEWLEDELSKLKTKRNKH
jgi:hypothetical protein